MVKFQPSEATTPWRKKSEPQIRTSQFPSLKDMPVFGGEQSLAATGAACFADAFFWEHWNRASDMDTDSYADSYLPEYLRLVGAAVDGESAAVGANRHVKAKREPMKARFKKIFAERIRERAEMAENGEAYAWVWVRIPDISVFRRPYPANMVTMRFRTYGPMQIRFTIPTDKIIASRGSGFWKRPVMSELLREDVGGDFYSLFPLQPPTQAPYLCYPFLVQIEFWPEQPRTEKWESSEYPRWDPDAENVGDFPCVRRGGHRIQNVRSVEPGNMQICRHCRRIWTQSQLEIRCRESGSQWEQPFYWTMIDKECSCARTEMVTLEYLKASGRTRKCPALWHECLAPGTNIEWKIPYFWRSAVRVGSP